MEFELFFGIWLLVGLMPKVTWLAAIGCFVTFAGVSFYKAAILQEISCGCFGVATISPWYTMTFDLIVVGLLIVFRPRGVGFQWKVIVPADSNGNLQLISIGYFGLSWFLIAFPISAAIFSFEPALLEVDGTIFGTSEVVILEPDSWQGKTLPLFSYIRSDIDFSVGKWTLVLYEAKCDNCKKVLQELDSNDQSILLVDVAGKMNNEIRQMFTTKPWAWGVLSPEKQWFIKTPTILETNDGICVSVSVH